MESHWYEVVAALLFLSGVISDIGLIEQQLSYVVGR